MADSKSPSDWMNEIAQLGRDINARATLIAEKREQKRSLSLAAVQGDATAGKLVRSLATEIDNLVWSQELADDALIVANEKLQETEKALQSAKTAALLAERDRVQAEAEAMRPRYVAVIDELVSMLETTYQQGREVFRLTEDAGQASNVANSHERRVRRTVANYLLAKLRDTYLYRDWTDFPYADHHLRREAITLFGAAGASNVVAGDTTPEESELVA